jgi:uncharacterized protein
MHFSIQELVAKGVPVELSGTFQVPEAVSSRRDIAAIGPLRFAATAQPLDTVVDVRGRLSTELEALCARCLQSVSMQLDIPFHEQFRKGEEGSESDADEIEVNVVDSDRVDLKPYVEETLFMNIPYAPLCKESCRGLCPECGQNLNERACGCAADRIDPRLAELKKFFES